ncbi:MAG TPA: prolyl oligopeptidase family serine peptidase, partial [Sphingobacterium sp.]|nr:prolyl oligopeptidase family serine peptidase [Sphingobacterium sp.]
RRDVWGFHAEVQFLANRGYLVFQVNYRGSVGFGKEFYAAGFKQWGGNIQNDINDGVTWLINQGIADKNNIAIMGSGFGGYSALYAACFHPTLYKCAVSSSGYTNLFTYMKEIPPYFQSRIKLYHQIIGDPQKESDLFKAISPLFHAEKIRTPLLIFQGGKDRFNSTTDVNQLVQRVKNNDVPVRYIYNKDEGKKFRKEENIVTYYQEIEQFLSTHLK